MRSSKKKIFAEIFFFWKFPRNKLLVLIYEYMGNLA